MIDALLYAVRDTIIGANIGYGTTECGVYVDGKPSPRCGMWSVAVHNGKKRPGSANERNLYELYDFTVTLTMRIVTPLDRVGEQQMARNVPLKDVNDVPLGLRQ